MSLTDIPLPDFEVRPVPEPAERLIVEAEARIEAFHERRSGEGAFAFVSSDFRAVQRALAWIRSERLAPGKTFCEWGSGFGVVAMLAATEGFHATGIEVEPELVDAAVALASEFAIEAEFVQGSFIPEGCEERPDDLMEMAWLDYGAPPAYEALGRDPDDFDLVFAYPWPGEWGVIRDMFDDHASAGALLLSFHGTEGLKLHRRDPPQRRRT